MLKLIDKPHEMSPDSARDALRENVEEYLESMGATPDLHSANVRRGSVTEGTGPEALRILHVIDRLDVGGQNSALPV